MEDLWLFLVQVNLFLQNLGTWLAVPMKFFTFLGNEEFYLLVMPALYWCIDAGLGIRLGLILMLSNGINAAFKFLFHTPRPFWISDRVVPYVAETSFGVPSGHSQNAAVLWGYLGIKVKPIWLKVIFFALIFFVGLSRLYLGVHFLIDVLVGWTIGLLIVWLFLLVEHRWGKRIRDWTTQRQLIAVGISTFILILIPMIAQINRDAVVIPQLWLDNFSNAVSGEEVLNPFSMDGVITAAAAWFGLLIGLIFLKKIGYTFKVDGTFTQKVVRFVIGVVGVLIIWAGLRLVFPTGISILSPTLRFIRYALVGFWISGLAPVVFRRLKLAE